MNVLIIPIIGVSQQEAICFLFWLVHLAQEANNRKPVLSLTQRFLLFHRGMDFYVMIMVNSQPQEC